MNLFHLRYFATLAKTEHYGKAAEMLAITQPSLSYAISALEDELGVRLFEKHGRNIILTKYGKVFYSDISEILDKLDNAIRDMKLAANGEGEINIAFLRTLGTDFVPRMIRGYQKAKEPKEISFRLFCDYGMSADILSALKNREVDVAFCSRLENNPEIDFFPIAEQRMVLLVPHDHPLSGREYVNLEETLKYRHIIFRKKSGLRSLIDEYFKSVGGYPEVSYEIAEDQVAAGFVAQGFGIMVAPVFAGLEALPVKQIPIRHPSHKRYFYMAVLKDAYQPPLVKEFIKYVLDQTRDHKTFTFG